VPYDGTAAQSTVTMRHSVTAVLILIASCMAAEAQQKAKGFEPFDFTTTDPFGRYTMLDLKRVDQHHVETLVRRVSTKSGSLAFTRRLIDCRGEMRFKTLGSNDSLEALSKSKPDTRWNTFVEGSTAHATAVNGCAFH
jgi:hypothetical protein